MSSAYENFSNNEEQIVRFIDHELTPEQERSLLDECASNDEMRGLLKQHVSLSRGLAASLAGVTVPAAAEESLSAEIAAMRTVQPAAASGGAFVRNAIVSAVAGLTVVAFMTAAYLAPKPAAPVTQPQITAPAPVAPQPAAPVVEQAPVASKATSIHHRAPRHAAVATPTPEPTQVAATPQPTPTKQRRVEKLDERHRVKD